MDPSVGKIDRYEVIKELGRGGFGVVYLAKQKSTGQQVALKMLLTDRIAVDEAMKDEQLRRFQREMKLITKLSDPHIVKLYDSGVVDDKPYMVLEFVEGDELAQIIKKAPLDNADTKRIMSGALKAVANAHDHGIVHRDLKPENIMVVGSGKRASAKVLDFGIAGLTGGQDATPVDADEPAITVAGQIRGTPSYMAPEQLQLFSEPTPQTDIYALGLILLECLTGLKAVQGDTLQEIVVKQISQDVEMTPEIAQGPFGWIIEKATQKTPEFRFTSVEEMLDAVEAADPNAAPSPSVSSASTLAMSDGDPSTLMLSDADAGVDSGGGGAGRVALIALIVLAVGGAAAFFALSGDDGASEAEAAATGAAAEGGGPAEAGAQTAGISDTMLQLWATQVRRGTVQGLAGITQRDEALEAFLADAMVRARLAREEKRYEESVALYKEVLEKVPDHAPAMEGLGLTYHAMELYDEAIAWLKKALERDPQLENAQLMLAVSYESNGDYEEAVGAYQDFLDRFPDSKNQQMAQMQMLSLKREVVDDKTRKKKKKRRKKKEEKESEVKRVKEFD